MKICPVCGAKADTKFCPECGADLQNEKDQVKCPTCGTISAGKFCPECGTNLMDVNSAFVCPTCGKVTESKFCPECGTKMTKAEEEKAPEVAAEVKAEAPQAEEKKSGAGTGVFMGLGIIILGVLIASLCGVPIPYL